MRVTLCKAAGYTRRKVYYLTSKGDFVEVAHIVRKRPNWQLTLTDGRQFLVDPRTTLETKP